MHGSFTARKKIAVIGTGISGMAAAWLLSARHDVTVYECDRRIGGHSNTVFVEGAKGPLAVDTGFIVYNELTYPNLTALFAHLNVPTQRSSMSFAVSLAGGDIEYSGSGVWGLFAEKRNLLRPRFWSMLRDVQRFYREAPRDLALLEECHTTLGDYLDVNAYGSAFRTDHLLPMAASIWSTPSSAILNYPAASFIRFQDSHGLLRLRNRPPWRTVAGGSRVYVERLTRSYADRIQVSNGVTAVRRLGHQVQIRNRAGEVATFDCVVIATHADQALDLLEQPTDQERRLLGAFAYSRNTAVLHSDPAMMPRRRAVWSSWNHIGQTGDGNAQCGPTVTYWMNALQNIPRETPLFVTLNPQRMPRHVWHRETYEHPMFDSAAIRAQRQLWSLQGRQNTWYCGAYFGAGFHEDGLQAGLAVAEALRGGRRPWTVADESGRIALRPVSASAAQPEFHA
ncbi:MAG: FAD-dependent oxidoreductase [Xanthobacteraceae bacterium]